MKVALISDTHGYLPEIHTIHTKRHSGDHVELVDAVIHAGDIGVDRDPITWFHDKLYPWCRYLDVPVYATFGNHDRIGEKQAIPDPIPVNLRLEVDVLVDVLGVKVWFSPWSMRYGDWAFMHSDTMLAKKYMAIPETTEVIVTHGPPLDAGDLTTDGRRTGSSSLRDKIVNGLPKLRLVVTGHIHEARGEYTIETVDGRQVRVLNVSHVNEWYEPIHKPVIIDWP